MRELKFRVWSEEDREYRTDCDVFKLFHGKTGCPATIYSDEDDRFDIEQYTGLKDKNGKEIYDGDIVNVIGIGIAQVIDSLTGEWMLYYKREPDEIKNGFVCVVPKNKPSGLWKANTTSYIEVVGNIHENAELLEEEE